MVMKTMKAMKRSKAATALMKKPVANLDLETSLQPLMKKLVAQSAAEKKYMRKLVSGSAQVEPPHAYTYAHVFAYIIYNDMQIISGHMCNYVLQNIFPHV